MKKWNEEGVYPEYQIWGKDFSPAKLKNLIPNLVFDENTHEAIDIGSRGRFKDKEYGYGSCTIIPPSNEIYTLEYICDLILENRKILDKLNIESEFLKIFWVGCQGNMEFSSDQLLKISQLKVTLAITYIYVEQSETFDSL